MNNSNTLPGVCQWKREWDKAKGWLACVVKPKFIFPCWLFQKVGVPAMQGCMWSKAFGPWILSQRVNHIMRERVMNYIYLLSLTPHSPSHPLNLTWNRSVVPKISSGSGGARNTNITPSFWPFLPLTSISNLHFPWTSS